MVKTIGVNNLILLLSIGFVDYHYVLLVFRYVSPKVLGIKIQILFIAKINMSQIIHMYHFCPKTWTLKPPGSLRKSEKYMYFLPV